MKKISVMDVRKTLAEYYLFIQAKFFKGVWQEEKETMESIWQTIAMRGSSVLYRETSSVHVTTSAIILSNDLKHVLMNFHKKHASWKHFGGHLEKSDRSLAESIMREVKEETGLETDHFICSPALAVGDAFDRPLDVHIIGMIGQENEVDIDIRYLFVTSGKPDAIISNESNEVRWVPVEKALNLVSTCDPCNIERLLLKARWMGGDSSPDLYRRMFGTQDIGEATGFFGKL